MFNKKRIGELEERIAALELKLKQMTCNHPDYKKGVFNINVCTACDKWVNKDEVEAIKAKKLVSLKRQIAELEQ